MNTNKSYTLTVSLIALIFLLSGTMGYSQSRQKKGPSMDEFFQRFDADNDEKLSQEEFSGPDDHFSRYDENDDGYIEKDEMPNVPPPPNRKK